MSRRQGGSHAAENSSGVALAGGAVLLDPGGERGAIDVLHHDVRQAELGRLSYRIDADHVGMGERGDGTGLSGESRVSARLGDEVGGEDLDRHQPLEGWVPGEKHCAHAAVPERPEQLIVGSQ